MNFVVLDVETGGLKPGRHSLLEVGMVAYKDGQITGEFSSYVAADEYIVMPKAMEVNGLNLAEVAAKGLWPMELVLAIIKFIKESFDSKDDYQLLGHNLSLDKYMMKHLFEQAGQDMDDHMSYRMVDTTTMIALCKELGLLPEDTPRSLHKVAEQLNVLKRGSEHTALGDAHTTLAVYEELLRLLKGAMDGTDNRLHSGSTTAP
ncbi:hypothetical protein D3C85_454860 [compost metagenome]